MAKGFNSRGMGGFGGGMNMNMMKQVQKMQQDMIVAAVNEALRAAESDSASTMQQLTGGLGLPF